MCSSLKRQDTKLMDQAENRGYRNYKENNTCKFKLCCDRVIQHTVMKQLDYQLKTMGKKNRQSLCCKWYKLDNACDIVLVSTQSSININMFIPTDQIIRFVLVVLVSDTAPYNTFYYVLIALLNNYFPCNKIVLVIQISHHFKSEVHSAHDGNFQMVK